MSFKALQSSPCVVILAHPNDKNMKVSEKAEAFGLNYLRAEPSSVRLTIVPDIIQPRYALFKACLSQFAWASWYNKVGTSKGASYAIKYSDVKGKLLPFRPPPAVLAWTTPPPEETLEQIRNKIKVSEIVAGGKTALAYQADNWEGFSIVGDYKCNIRATAPMGHVNLKSIISSRALLSILTALIHAVRYPAFADTEHETTFKLGNLHEDAPMVDAKSPDVVKAVASAFDEVIGAPGSFPDVKQTEVPVWSIDYKNLPPALTSIDIAGGAKNLPKGDGLWFPYFSFLTQYDVKAVPEFIRNNLVLSFGSSIEDAITACNEVCADWGMIALTEFGKEISHMVTVISVALKAQSRPIPVFRESKYLGTVIIGAGYTLNRDDGMIRPQGESDLKKAFEASDAHAATIKSIASRLGNDNHKAKVLAVKSMLELRNILVGVWTIEEDKDLILKHASALDFSEPSWPVNVTTLTRALSILSDPNFSLKTASPSDFPIHSSCLFSTDTTELVWSCFGSFAPSFRIPGGKEFDVAEDMEVVVKSARGNQTSKKIVRIAVRNKVLDQAIRDIKEVREKKTILNPVVAPKIRASQQNMDKYFEGPQGKELMSAIRIYTGIHTRGTKRANEGGADGGSVPKRTRGVLDEEL